MRHTPRCRPHASENTSCDGGEARRGGSLQRKLEKENCDEASSAALLLIYNVRPADGGVLITLSPAALRATLSRCLGVEGRLGKGADDAPQLRGGGGCASAKWKDAPGLRREGPALEAGERVPRADALRQEGNSSDMLSLCAAVLHRHRVFVSLRLCLSLHLCPCKCVCRSEFVLSLESSH
jgi:hypothetical protein